MVLGIAFNFLLLQTLIADNLMISLVQQQEKFLGVELLGQMICAFVAF